MVSCVCGKSVSVDSSLVTAKIQRAGRRPAFNSTFYMKFVSNKVQEGRTKEKCLKNYFLLLIGISYDTS